MGKREKWKIRRILDPDYLRSYSFDTSEVSNELLFGRLQSPPSIHDLYVLEERE